MKILNVFIAGFIISLSLMAQAKSSAPNLNDKAMKGEVKRSTPILIEDPVHGSLRLNRNGSFNVLGKSRFDVQGGWDISNGKLVLKWSESEDTLSLRINKSKDGLIINNRRKDASGKFILGNSANSLE